MSSWPHTFATQYPSIALSWLDDQFNQISSTATTTISAAGANIVGYTWGGTSVAGSTASKLNQVLSVKDAPFNAKGDGTTDDTASMASAAAVINTTGGVLFIPSGTYISTAALTISTNVTVMGQGRATVIKAGNTSSHLYGIIANTQTGVVITSLLVDMNKGVRGTARGVAIGMVECTDSMVVGCWTQNTRGDASTPGVGIYLGGLSVRGKVIGCTAINSGTTGDATLGDGIFCSGSKMVVANCVSDTCLDTGQVLDDANDSLIVGCVSKDCGAGFALTASTQNVSNVACVDHVTNGYAEATTTGGCRVAAQGTTNLTNVALTNVIVKGNTNTGTGMGIYIVQASTGLITNVSLNNVIVQNAQGNGLLVEKVFDFIGSDIKIDSSGAHGIQLKNCTRPVLENAVVLDAGTSSVGIYTGIWAATCTATTINGGAVLNRSGTTPTANGINNDVSVNSKFSNVRIENMGVASYSFTTNAAFIIATGGGSPDTVVPALTGSTWHRTDGGAGTSLYIKETGSGTTGWVGK